MNIIDFYQGKRVFITGHTGFKGSWLCRTLIKAGAEVTGYALTPPTTPALFTHNALEKEMNSVIGDVRDLAGMRKVFETARPDIVIHLAAQPLVRESYARPVDTYETNVMGTVNVLECIRQSDSVKSFVNVTTDKVYKNREWEWGYRENEELNGYDPYSNSKSCSELVTDSYRNSFLEQKGVAVSTARAGNVIGGGDFAKDRIIPDCIRAAVRQEKIILRNPYSVRPYQHVLEPVMAYLLIAQQQYEDITIASSYNVGPDEADCVDTGQLALLFCNSWKEHTGMNASWCSRHDGGPHEANFLALDCSRMKAVFGWRPIWNVAQAVDKTIEWAVAYHHGEEWAANRCMEQQIEMYLAAMIK